LGAENTWHLRADNLRKLLSNTEIPESHIVSSTGSQFVKYLAVVLQQSQQHTIIKPDPRPYQPLTNPQQQAQVPDGGAGWAFMLAAIATVAVAAIKRYLDRRTCNSASQA
jgi:hypothetical protein